MQVTAVKTASLVENVHHVKASKLYDTAHAQVIHITLEPGESMRRHITPVDVFFYVIEGEGIVEVGDEKQSVGPDTLINSPANIPHCWYNESGGTVRFLVVKVPRPSKPTKLL